MRERVSIKLLPLYIVLYLIINNMRFPIIILVISIILSSCSITKNKKSINEKDNFSKAE